MIFGVPSYYKEFRCKADRCQDSCCIGWEIDIDEDTFSYYKSVEGAFGQRLRKHMTTEDGNSFVLRENGWCPFLNEKKLCDICIHLGEEALSEVCTEFPRFTMEYADVREKILSLSCEEVGRLIFFSDDKIGWEEQEILDGFACEEGEDERAKRLRAARTEAVAILQDRTKPVFERAAEYLVYCMRLQRELFGGGRLAPEHGRKYAAATAETAQNAKEAYLDFLARMERYDCLEALDDIWENTKRELRGTFDVGNYQKSQQEFLAAMSDREYEYEHLLVYFTYRYFMRAYYDDNILTKAQLAVASVLVIRDMDVMRYLKNQGRFTLEDRIDTVKIYAKEVEHSEENMELLAEDFQFEEVFAPERLLCQL